jgi:hypothetical protein
VDYTVPAMPYVAMCINQLNGIWTSEIATLLCQDRIIARLQQPYSLDCIPVEAEYQVTSFYVLDPFSCAMNKNFKLLRTDVIHRVDHVFPDHCAIFLQKQFSELLLKAASDYGALTASVGDFQWSQNFRESPAVWGVSWKFSSNQLNYAVNNFMCWKNTFRLLSAVFSQTELNTV